MPEVHMTAGVTTGDQFTTVKYPDETIHLRVPSGTARLMFVTIDPPYDVMARELSALYATGNADASRIVEIAYRHGLKLESDSD